jgi:hypothetical protein
MRRRYRQGVSSDATRFPPAVADRLQEPEGSVVVHVTPAERTRRASDYRWLLMACHDRPVLASLVLDNAGRLRFSRTERGAGTVQARADVSALMDARTWRVELSWTPTGATVSARPS